MEMNDMIMVSIDDHLIEPADTFKYFPESLKDQAPKIVRHPDNPNLEVWSFQGDVVGTHGLSAVMGLPKNEWGMDPTYIGLVGTVFLCGQVIESNFLTPKLIGSRIGLHPVWIIFGLFIFGALFGFTGILLAVPLTATCGVIIKHFALEYKKRFT